MIDSNARFSNLDNKNPIQKQIQVLDRKHVTHDKKIHSRNRPPLTQFFNLPTLQLNYIGYSKIYLFSNFDRKETSKKLSGIILFNSLM